MAFCNDLLWYTLVQSYVLGLMIYGLIGMIDNELALSRWSLIRDYPVWMQCVLFLVVHDVYIYWFYRWQHHSPTLWRIHEAHHSTTDVDWLAGSRSHPLEILINQTLEYLPIIILASPEVAVIKGSIDAVWGMYIHSNIDVRSGVLQYVINGPEMHRWHQSDDADAHNKNIRANRPMMHKPTSYGLGTQEFPSSYFKQIAYAFRRDPTRGT